MNIQETLAMLRESLRVKQGSTTSVTTWESKPIITVRYLGADSELTFVDIGDDMEYDFDAPPAEQLAEHCHASLNKWLISTGSQQVKALADWLNITHDTEEWTYTNGELMDFVWIESNLHRKSAQVHQELAHLTGLRRNYVFDKSALAKAIAQQNN